MQEKKITHAGNIKRDRRYGEQEELNFLSDAGKFMNLQGEQINKEVVVKLNTKTHQLPDTKIGNFYFENKIKYPTEKGYFGLEKYRYDSLISLSNTPEYKNIIYLINPSVRQNTNKTLKAEKILSSFNLKKNNRVGAFIKQLEIDSSFENYSYRAGRRVWTEIYYFHVEQFTFLDLKKWNEDPLKIPI